MLCVYVVYGLKNTLFSTYCTLLLLLYAPPFFYKAHHFEKRGVLWLASYPVRCDWRLLLLLFWKPKQNTFSFTMKHSVSRTWRRRQQQYYSENKNHALFLCVYIWVVFCKSCHTVYHMTPLNWCIASLTYMSMHQWELVNLTIPNTHTHTHTQMLYRLLDNDNVKTNNQKDLASSHYVFFTI